MLELATTKKLLVYSGDAHPALARDIARHLGVDVALTRLVERILR